MLSAPINTATLGDNTVIAAPSGSTQFIRVHGYVLVGAGVVNVTWKGVPTAGAVSGAMDIAAAGGTVQASYSSDGWFDLAVGDALKLNLSAAIQVSGHVTYSIRG